MCDHCGCDEPNAVTVTDLESGAHSHLDSGDTAPSRSSRSQRESWHTHAHAHSHAHAQGHSHAHGHSHDGPHAEHGPVPDARSQRTIRLDEDLLARNRRLAEWNRGWFAGRDVQALNFMSAPGAGKTRLLERTLNDLRREFSFCVVEGDQATTRDSERIQKTGCRVVQINTGAGCHLDAAMLQAAVRQLNPPPHSVLLIENVGNLVCPSLFDLGEVARVVVVSVPEGDDKPLKYPGMFRSAGIVLLNKIDLLPHVDFSRERFQASLRQVNSRADLLAVSASTGEGLPAWYDWLRRFLIHKAP